MTHNPRTPRPTLPYQPGDTPPTHGTFPSAAEEFLGRIGLAGPDSTVGVTTFEVDRPEPPPAIPGFEILGELGAGGMGVVYQAREVALNRVVAVKMIRPDARPGPRDLLRFQAEAEAVAAVRHPNVVEVYSSGRVGDRPYFVMEYVGGGSLAARLRAGGPLAPKDAAAVVAAVARGVHAAHAAGIVHRDLKPGNVLLEDAELGMTNDESKKPTSGPSPGRNSSFIVQRSSLLPKVSDFGLAKRLDPGVEGMTRTVAVVGTPAYMAPEQARGRGKFVGPEADVYALGVVLYECLTGRPPFCDEDPIELMKQVADATPAAPRSVVHGVPRDLDLICRKCLAKEAGDRYATAADLAADLDRFLAGRPVVARPIPWPVRAGRWVRRNPAAAALAALAALVLTLGPAAVVWYRGELRELEAAAAARDEQAWWDGQARADAEKLAAARERIAVEGVIRRREADRPTGWTWASRTDLRRAAGLAAGDAAALAALRTEAATVLLAADLRPAAPVAVGFTAESVAASPDGKLVALGCQTAWGLKEKAGFLEKTLGKAVPMRVLVIDPVTGATVHDVSFPARAVYRDGELAPDRVMSLAFSPDGKQLYAAARSGRVVRLDLGDSGARVTAEWKTPNGHNFLAVTADGTGVLGTGDIPVEGKHLVFRWDAMTGKKVDWAEAPGACTGFVVEPGTGAVVGALSHGLVRSPADKLNFPPPPATAGEAWVRHPAVLPGGRVIAAARNAGVELWDAQTLRPVARFTDPGLLDRAAHPDDVTRIAVHPSGAYLATASADRAVRVWAVASGQRVAAVQLPGNGPAPLAWSADGRFLLAACPNQTARFEFAPPSAERFTAAHPHPLVAAVPAGGGRVVALGDFTPLPDPPAQLLFRTGPDGRPDAGLGLPRHAERSRPRPWVSVHPVTGRVAFASTGTRVGWWSPGGEGPAPAVTSQSCRYPAFTPDGAAVWAVVEADAVRAWDAATGRPLGPGWVNHGGKALTGVGSLDALAVGRTVGVVGGGDGAIHLLGPGAGWMATLSGERDPVEAVALTAAEDVIAGGTRSGKLRFVRVADRVELPAVADAHPGGVTAVSFAPDGALLATGGKDRAVRFWKRTAAGGYEPVAAVTGLPAPVRSLAFERDRPVLVLLLAGERAARLWDAARLQSDLAELGLGW